MFAVDDVGSDGAPRTIVSESVPACFLVGSVSVLHDVIKFSVELLLCQVGLWFKGFL